MLQALKNFFATAGIKPDDYKQLYSCMQLPVKKGPWLSSKLITVIVIVSVILIVIVVVVVVVVVIVIVIVKWLNRSLQTLEHPASPAPCADAPDLPTKIIPTKIR